MFNNRKDKYITMNENENKLFETLCQHLVYTMRDANISIALNEKAEIMKNDAAIAALTEVLEQSGHTVTFNKNKMGYLRLSIDGQKQNL